MPFSPDTRLVITPIIGQDGEGSRWRLVEPLTYVGKDETFTIPAGYITDLASSPPPFWWIFPPYGRGYMLAPVLHDYLIDHVIGPMGITSRDADGLFRRVMRESGVGFSARWTMWAAVRAAAVFSARRRHGLGLWRDLPALALVAILSSPVWIVTAPIAAVRYALVRLP